jgi:hypothetical protein
MKQRNNESPDKSTNNQNRPSSIHFFSIPPQQNDLSTGQRETRPSNTISFHSFKTDPNEPNGHHDNADDDDADDHPNR